MNDGRWLFVECRQCGDAGGRLSEVLLANLLALETKLRAGLGLMDVALEIAPENYRQFD